jgi:16S rRNA G966 N2-methylase RsmD
MSRAPKQPVIYQERLNIPKEFLRFATPKDVAYYRAERLKCEVLAELGAGIGGQTIAFSKRCKKVIAVELNKKRAEILNQNIRKLKIKNVMVINGDALNKSVIQKIAKEKPNIIFFDTERPEQSERSLTQINPSIDKILDAYLPITKKVAIEIPPYTKEIDELRKKFYFEREFISLKGQLNRLTLYFNELKRCEKSAIALPSKEQLANSEKEIESQKVRSAKNFKYLYAIDPTISVAGLEENLSSRLNASIFFLDNKSALVSNKEVKSYFLTGYKIIKICKNDKREILNELEKAGAGKVTLRYSIVPEDYWKIRKFYEKELTGKKEINLFVNKEQNEAILCSKI